MDPGRKAKEMREVTLIAVGDELLLGSGVLWRVYSFHPTDSGLVFHLERRHGDRLFTHSLVTQPGEELLCKTVMGPTA